MCAAQGAALLSEASAAVTGMAGGVDGYYTDESRVAYCDILGSSGIVVGIVLLLLPPPIRKLMSGVR